MVYNKVKGKAPLRRNFDYDPLPSEEEIIQDYRMDFEVLLKICPCFFGEPCSPVAYSSCSKDVVFGCRYQNDPGAKRKLYELAQLLAPIFGCFSRELILYLWKFKNPLLQEEQGEKEGIEEFLGALAGGDLKRDLVIKPDSALKPVKISESNLEQQAEGLKDVHFSFEDDSEELEDLDTISEDGDLEGRRVSLAASSACSGSIDIKEVAITSMPPKYPTPPPLHLSSTVTVLPAVPTISLTPTPLSLPRTKSSWRGIKKSFKAAFKRLCISLVCS